MKIILEGDEFYVEHEFTPDRVVILFCCLPVLADRDGDGVWELSGEPASPEELKVINGLQGTPVDSTVVTITKE